MAYAYKQGLDVPKDANSGSVPTLSVEHTEIHAGRMFTLAGTLTIADTKIGSVAITIPDETSASAVVDMTNAAADLTYTARNKGREGNSITVTHADPGAASQALTVSVAGSAITVSLATNGAGAITSTANQVVAAIRASAAANDLVTVAAEGAGTGVTNAKAVQSLAGGKDVLDVHFKAASVSVSGGPFTITLTEDASFIAAGTAVTPVNRNRHSANTSQLSCKVNADTTVANGAGVLTLDTMILGAATPQPTPVGGSAGRDQEWDLKVGNYILTATNGSGGAKALSYELAWYERTE